jgi:hypothetical protein
MNLAIAWFINLGVSLSVVLKRRFDYCRIQRIRSYIAVNNGV